jgi:hypothetical protein
MIKNNNKTTTGLFSKVGKAEFLGRTVARPHVYLAEEVCINTYTIFKGTWQ